MFWYSIKESSFKKWGQAVEGSQPSLQVFASAYDSQKNKIKSVSIGGGKSESI